MGSIWCCNERESHSQGRNSTLHENNARKSVRNTTYGFIPCKYLGKGVYGTTVEVINRDQKEQRFAQKIVSTQLLVQDYLLLLPKLMHQLDGLRLIKPKLWVCEGEKLYVLMQKMAMGDLYYYMKKNENNITQHNLKGLCVHIMQGLKQIHDKGYIYRCLTPQNILITNKDGAVALSEVIFSVKGPRAYSYFGVAAYTPPQIFSQMSYGYDKSLDFWMLGVLLFQILTGYNYFEASTLQEIRSKVINFQVELLPSAQELDISQQTWDFISKLLCPFPNARLNFEEAKKHAFLKDVNWGPDNFEKNLWSVKQKDEKQEYYPHNRIIVSDFAKSRPLTRDLPNAFFEQIF